MDCPEALQIEVTNKCNFNCYMCIRRFWDTNLIDLNLDLYKKVLKSVSHYLKKIILYGFGEPFLNPNFIEMLRSAREILQRDSEILISTNGSLLDISLLEKILKIGINDISFSIDTMDFHKLEHIRSGSEPRILFHNLHSISAMKKHGKFHLRLGVEVVLMKSNFMDLPLLIEKMAEEDIDYIIVSNVMPYAENIFYETTYVTISRKPLEAIEPILRYYGRKIILDAIYETFGRIYSAKTDISASRILEEIWRETEKNGYWINLPLFFESMEKMHLINEVEKIFRVSQKIAHEYGVSLSLPNLYPDAKNRRCPYIDKKVVFIRSDGSIAPCQEFAYKHSTYINMHAKTVNPILFGDLRNEDLIDVWNKEEYVTFREVRQKMSDNIPWCGDCLYSMFKCFFAENNNMDCFLNKPSCSECLYSVNISQCNI